MSVWYKKNIFHTIMPVSYGLTHTARVGSVMATLSVTLERFFAIVFPFKDVEVVKRWLLPCAVTFTVTYNIPKFFEVSLLLFTIFHCFFWCIFLNAIFFVNYLFFRDRCKGNFRPVETFVWFSS